MHRTQPSRAWPSIDQIWVVALVTLIALKVQLTPIMPNDFWWHIATGRIIAQTGDIPRADQFSYLRDGQAYYNQPWLAQLLMYGGYELGGPALLVFLQTLLITGSFALLYTICRREGADVRVAVMSTLVGALVAMDNWQIRPQTYAIPLCIATLGILLAWRRSGRAPLWALPLIMLLWVNLHGTFTLLPVLCGIFWLGAIAERQWFTQSVSSPRSWQELRALALWSAAALLATLANPRGFGIWGYVAGLLSNRSVGDLVTEWASPFRVINEPMTWIFFGVFAIMVAILAWRRRYVHLTDLLVLLPFTALSFQSVRNILWFGIVAAPICARLLSAEARPARRPIGVVFMNRLIAGLLALMVLGTLPWWKEALDLPPAVGNLISVETPVAATEELRARGLQPQRLFHEMGFGSYLIWSTPDRRVFIDPRIELYPYEQWRDYIVLGQGQEVDALAEKYDFDGWLIDAERQAGLVATLDRHPAWQRVFTAEQTVYFAPRLNAGRSK
ncbi:MAG: hypothetical protein JOZ51_10260 [Chloroflexi bacterium]|nr:hypothetical protein [Chloroflexota bacterium]